MLDIYDGKRFCILGDSVSTYESYTPSNSVFYNAWFQNATQVTSVEDTWWMQVILRCSGILGVNNSHSGSTVYGSRSTSGCSDYRTRALGKNGPPDVILIAMGCNDWGFGIPLDYFSNAYQLMLSKLSTLYPKSEIWCGTLLRGQQVSNQFPPFFNAERCGPLDPYNNMIRANAAFADCFVAELGSNKYSAIDAVHPTKKGMDFLAQCWLHALENGYKH